MRIYLAKLRVIFFLQQNVMNFEKVLLHTLRFDLQIEHPYKFLLEYVKVFNMEKEDKSIVCTNAWTFINDSYSTTLCLMWDPEVRRQRRRL